MLVEGKERNELFNFISLSAFEFCNRVCTLVNGFDGGCCDGLVCLMLVGFSLKRAI